MTNLRFGVTCSAVIKFSPFKVCFVSIPREWIHVAIELAVFKLNYGENREAFVSCTTYRQNNTHYNKVEVSINAKYAEKLGLKEKEKVCLQQVLNDISKVQELTLEPLSSDDWEMLELNTSAIEQNLMNQIRVVWLNQIFPVWLNNSSLYVKVVDSKPTTQPLLLAECSEVHIVPKGRTPSSKNSSKTLSSQKNSLYHRQFEHLRKKGKTSSPLLPPHRSRSQDTPPSNPQNSVLRALSLISSFFPNSGGEEKFSSFDDSVEDFKPLNLDLVLRVVPYTRPGSRPLPLIVESTTVFMSADTFVSVYGPEEIPLCFVATLQKFTMDATRRDNKRGHLQNTKVKSAEMIHPQSTKDSPMSEDERQVPFSSVCVTVMVVQSSEEDEFGLPPSLFITKGWVVVPLELKRCLNLEVASLVHMVGVQTRPSSFNMIVLHPVAHLPKNVTNEMLVESFENWVSESKTQNLSFVISDGTLMNLKLSNDKKTTRHDFFISLKEGPNQTLNSSFSSISSISPNSSASEPKRSPDPPKYGYLYSDTLKDIQIVNGSLMILSISAERPYLQRPQGLYREMDVVSLEALGGIQEMADQALRSLEFWLKLRPIAYLSIHPSTYSGCLLICGPKGVGKTVFANALCQHLQRSPHHVFVKVIHCLPLKGKRVDTISRKWEEVMSEAVSSQPSVVLFEKLDSIASAPTSHEQEVGPDGAYFSSIAQYFIELVRKIRGSENRVSVIVTSQSTHTLHSSLVKTKGRHVFDSILEMQLPNKTQREEILCALVRTKTHISAETVNNVSWKKVASKTEGYVAQDLDSLVDRATHAAWVRMANEHRSPEILLNLEDFEMALEGHVPSSLRGIPLHTHDHRTWNDVGGLRDVKKVVQQIIMWPVKYKQMFRNYHMRPQTNLLLYGAPGTGKTLLAGVIANECGFNFISINGPELLSKYIGASEQAVRDLFKRASAARPCILFFDEFDSIAPRRGHDSTGVTDRVVNQLLTQLDGVESLEGVHVIAASNRPELIDPALLRPGRLDKCLLCPLPNQCERLEILKCLSSKLSLSEDINLDVISAQTTHFSGADLQALLYSANIEALHDTQSKSSRRYSASSDDLNYSIAGDKILYMPSLEDGLSVPTYEEGKKIIQEVAVVKERFCGVLERRRSRRRSTLNIAITHAHLMKVLQEMKPSVSEKERKRYEAVFKDFHSILSGDAVNRDIGKRMTLA